MPELAVPLRPEQLLAAQAVLGHVAGLSANGAALAELDRRFPGFDPVAALLKTAVLNQLLSTNVWAIRRMAAHIADVMQDVSLASAPPDLVDRIALLASPTPNGTPRRHLSFASKFAHWFIDPERFPVYDTIAWWMLEYHLGRRETIWEPSHQYASYLATLQRLRDRAGLTCGQGELDGYLWLAGLWRWWRKQPEAPIHAEVKAIFVQPPAGIAAALATLLPDRT